MTPNLLNQSALQYFTALGYQNIEDYFFEQLTKAIYDECFVDEVWHQPSDH